MKENYSIWSVIDILVGIKCSGYRDCRVQTGRDLHSVAGAFTLTNRNSKRRQPTAT